MMGGCPRTFQFSPFSPASVSKIISNLKKSISCGLNEIDGYIMKLIQQQITPPLTHIDNLSLTCCIYPSTYKVGKVVPL
jgi:hypothetical protein